MSSKKPTGTQPDQHRVGELLVREKIITPLQLRKAIEDQSSQGGSLGHQLTKLGYLQENALIAFLSKQYGVPSIDPMSDTIDIPSEVLRSVSRDFCLRHLVIPIMKTEGNRFVVAMADPGNIHVIDDLRSLVQGEIDPVVATEGQICEAIAKYYSMRVTFEDVARDLDLEEIALEEAGVEEDISIGDLTRFAEEEPVVRLVNVVLRDAMTRGVSDIHLEPFEKQFRIRYRVDGILYEVMKPPFKLRHAIVSRIKIMARLDITERRIPQDGRIVLRLGKDKVMDFRVSTLPTVHGERVVLRLLDRSNLQLDMTKLGFEERALVDFKDALRRPHGMVLVTGPTGSGKTTTLYSALTELNRVTTNLLTVEDPVEYELFGISQIQVDEKAGRGFPLVIRSFLRQDPDIIMVGEIRDFETAEIAVKAALTGHLVLSTLHTNDAPSAVGRLLQMGIEPYLIAATINAIGAQRLVRKLCTECRVPVDIPKATLVEVGIPPDEIGTFQVMRGAGCQRCNNTGYRGRIAVYEIMMITDEIREFIQNGASANELKREAIRQGMKTLRMSALTKLKEGMTTLEEILRSTASD